MWLNGELYYVNVNRVLERSLAEDTKLGTKRKRSDLWFVDPLNPHERKRLDGWPVGLKNVGNTCWFSAVIQVGRNRNAQLNSYWLNLLFCCCAYFYWPDVPLTIGRLHIVSGCNLDISMYM
jgi:uncharacterized UBP type Zn finger protein